MLCPRHGALAILAGRPWAALSSQAGEPRVFAEFTQCDGQCARAIVPAWPDCCRSCDQPPRVWIAAAAAPRAARSSCLCRCNSLGYQARTNRSGGLLGFYGVEVDYTPAAACWSVRCVGNSRKLGYAGSSVCRIELLRSNGECPAGCGGASHLERVGHREDRDDAQVDGQSEKKNESNPARSRRIGRAQTL